MYGPIVLFIATVAEKGLYLAAMLVISRLLSVSDFGKFSFALYAGFSIAALAEFGFQPIVTRDVVASPARRHEVFGAALLLKVPLALAAAAAIGVMGWLGDLDREQAQLLWIIGLSQVAVTVSYLGHAIFRATQRLDLESLAAFVRGALYLGTSVGALLLGFPLSVAAWAILVGNIMSMAITLGLAGAIIRPALPRRLVAEARQLLAQAAPLAASIIATAVFSTLSVIALRLSMDDTSVGWYNSAHSLTSHMSFIPEVVTAALLPPMVVALQRHAADRQPLTEMVLVLLGLALPIAGGATLLAPHIMTLVFGLKFAPAAPALIWLIWTAPFTFVNVAYLLLLSTQKRQLVWPAFVLAGIAISVLSLIVLIPVLGSTGAAIARLAGEVGVFVLGTWQVRKALDYARLLAGIARICLALAGMVAVVWVSQSAPVLIPIGLGAAIYGLLIATLGPWPLQLRRAIAGR
jgi:O-antigen/teichoic acid export membrane protein